MELICTDVLTTGASYSENISRKLLSSSLRTDRLINELYEKQEKLAFFTKKDNQQWKKWISTPVGDGEGKGDIVEKLASNLDQGDWLNAIELRRRLTKVHEIRVEAGYEDSNTVNNRIMS